MKTICGIDCGGCGFKDSCKGCTETDGHTLLAVIVLQPHAIKQVVKTAL